MVEPSTLELGGLAALGTLGSVCAILLRSTHQNLQSLDTMRREAQDVAEKLRQQLREHDQLISELQALCAETERRLNHCRRQLQAFKRRRQSPQAQLDQPTAWSELGSAHDSPADDKFSPADGKLGPSSQISMESKDQSAVRSTSQISSESEI